MLDDDEPVDFPVSKRRPGRPRIVAEGHASTQYPGATKHVAVADRRKPNRANTMKELLAHRQHIDVRGRRSSSLCAYVANIVHVAAKARMCFQPPSVGQVDGM